MKLNYKLYSVCLSLLMTFCGCDNFLEETPKGSINDTYAQTEKVLRLSYFHCTRLILNFWNSGSW